MENIEMTGVAGAAMNVQKLSSALNNMYNDYKWLKNKIIDEIGKELEEEKATQAKYKIANSEKKDLEFYKKYTESLLEDYKSNMKMKKELFKILREDIEIRY